MSSFKGKTTEIKKLPTVFDGATSYTSAIQRAFIDENLDALASNYINTKSDLILIVPDDETNANASTMFLTLENEMFDATDELTNRIKNYALKNNGSDKMVIMFLNRNGYLSLYTIGYQNTEGCNTDNKSKCN